MPTRSNTRTTGASRKRNTRKLSVAAPASLIKRQPLIQMQAHWTVQAHPGYLEAASFHWQQ